MSYHNDMIEVISQNSNKLELILEMSNLVLQTEVSFTKGDLDLFVSGVCWYSNEFQNAIIEVKGHSGLVAHYKRHQLSKYKKQFPKAKQFVCYGKDKSLEFENFSFLSEEDLSY